MSEMKNSGVRYIGEIPQKWNCKKMKYLCSFNRGYCFQSEDFGNENDVKFVSTNNFENNIIDFNSCATTCRKLPDKFIIKNGDFMYTVTGSIGKTLFASNINEKMFYHYNLCKVIPTKGNNKKYLAWLLQSTGIKEQMDERTSKSVISMIAVETINNLYGIMPCLEEQDIIADFLNDKIAKIDEIMKKINDEIELLEKYRKSLITETVTKGLSKNVKMKDSEIDWIGEIPETWKIKKLKYLGTARNGLTYSPDDQVDEGILVLRSSNIREGKLEFKDNVYVNMKVPRNIILKKDDLLICSRNGSRNLIGKNALIDEKTAGQTYGAFMCVYRSKYNKFIHYILNSDIFTYYLSSFLTSTINQLTNENLYSIKIPFTYDIKEQEEIVNYLDKKCQEIDELIEDKQQQIEKMEKYKKSLIYEYVTGKKRVKGAEELYG